MADPRLLIAEPRSGDEAPAADASRAVGVLMAIYRGDDATLFRRALGSVLTQELPTRTTLHMYLGIDGPIGDAMQAVVDDNRGRIHHVVRSASNRGLANMLNDLIAARQDEQLFFRMDADDQALPGRFARQIEYLESHPDIDILGTDIIEDNASRGTRQVVRFCRGPRDARALIAKRVPVAHPTVCFRRRVLDRVRRYPDRRGNEDVAMWFECMRQGFHFDNVPEPLLLFTVSDDFWRRRGFKKAFSEFSCYIVGIWRLHGLTWRYIYPVFRLALRLSPPAVSRWLYRSNLRDRM